MRNLGFIGLGHMGSHMVTRLMRAHYPFTVYDRSKERAQSIPGVRVAESPGKLAADSDVVLISVTDDAAVEEVMFGPEGALSGVREGSLIIDLSTVSPGASRRLYAAAAGKGASMIDAAVSGSVPQVDEGNLVIFVGGDPHTFSECQSILQILGQHIFYMGNSGMGSTMKLVVNTLLGLGMQALAEAIALGEKAGLKRDLLLDVLAQTAVMSPSQKSKLANVKGDDYPTLFSLALMHKDLGLVMRQAADIFVPMPATAAAEQMYTAALSKKSDADFSIIIRLMRQFAGLFD